MSDLDETLDGVTFLRVPVDGLTRDFLERAAEEAGTSPDDLVAGFVEQGVLGLRVKAGEAAALSVKCPVCGAEPKAPCERGAPTANARRKGRPVSKRPHARRLVIARHVADHGSIGSEFR